MMKYIHIIIIAVGVMVMMVGCRVHRELGDKEGKPGVGVDESAATDNKPRLDSIINASYSRYCANFSCTVEGMALTGQVRIVHDSCIWISVNKIIEVGRIMITPTRVSGYVKILNKYYDGSYDDLRKRWGIDIDYATIEALFIGNCPPNCKKSREPERNGEQVRLWYTQQGKSQRKVTVTKGYESKMITTMDISTTVPQMNASCAYYNRTNISGQMIPSEIGVSLSAHGLTEQTRLMLSSITLNKVQNTPFTIPARYEKL